MLNILIWPLLIGSVLNVCVETYSLMHVCAIVVCIQIILFGLTNTLITLMMFGLWQFIVNYDFIAKSYRVTNSTLKNIIKMSEFDDSEGNKENIETLKSINSKISWCESHYEKYISVYTKAKTKLNDQILEFVVMYKKSVLKIDINNLMLVCNFLITLLTDIIFSTWELFKEFTIFGYYITKCEKYYNAGTTLYNSNLDTQKIENKSVPNKTNQLNQLGQLSQLDQLDQMNNLFNAMMPSLEAMKNIPITKQSKSSDKSMEDLFKMMGSLSTMQNKPKSKKKI